MIWLIGGTRESREIAQILSHLNINYLVTVTTVEAASLYAHNEARIEIGVLDAGKIVNLIEQHQITGIIDASHPYAQIISQQAIDLAERLKIPYLRYERPSLNFSATQRVEIEDLDTLITGDYLEGKRVLLTIGYKGLFKFKTLQKKATLFTRILPSLTSLGVAIEAGFTPDRIIAIRPPIERELERALWQQWKIETVVTKANGEAGGEGIKQELAQELGIELIVLTRPKIAYPAQTDKLETIITFCQNIPCRTTIMMPLFPMGE